MSSDDWLFQRAVDRVDVVDGLVVDYATAVCGRPALRRVERLDLAPGCLGTVTWSIDGGLVVEFRGVARGRHTLVVYDVGLLRSLRQRLRNRHLTVEHRSR